MRNTRARVEHFGYHAVEFLGAGQIMAERLLDDHAAPCALGRAATGRRRPAAWRPAGMRAAAPTCRRHGYPACRGRGQAPARWRSDARRPPGRRTYPARSGCRRPDCCQVDSLNGVRQCAWTAALTNSMNRSSCPVAAGEAGQTEARRQQATVGQVVDGRQ